MDNLSPLNISPFFNLCTLLLLKNYIKKNYNSRQMQSKNIVLKKLFFLNILFDSWLSFWQGWQGWRVKRRGVGQMLIFGWQRGEGCLANDDVGWHRGEEGSGPPHFFMIWFFNSPVVMESIYETVSHSSQRYFYILTFGSTEELAFLKHRPSGPMLS